jgi:hypothetical protein
MKPMQADHMDDFGADGRIIELISMKDGSMRIGLNWLRTVNWLQDHLLLQNPAPCGQFYTSLELYSSALLL